MTASCWLVHADYAVRDCAADQEIARGLALDSLLLSDVEAPEHKKRFGLPVTECDTDGFALDAGGPILPTLRGGRGCSTPSGKLAMATGLAVAAASCCSSACCGVASCVRSSGVLTACCTFQC